MSRRMITLAEFRARRQVSRTTDWKDRHRDPNYPQIYFLGGNVRGVREADANAYIEGLPEAPMIGPRPGSALVIEAGRTRRTRRPNNAA
jgi:hypothetical protein